MAVALILGGARSGKTAWAEKCAQNLGDSVTYLATARAEDQEMVQRIQAHQRSRPTHWGLVEEPLYLAQAIRHHDAPGRVLLVDCLTLWLTNLLMETENPAALAQEKQALLATLPSTVGEIILVGNETGMGIVPLGTLTRRFVDESGWLNQALASLCDRVTLVVAGLPLRLKGNEP